MNAGMSISHVFAADRSSVLLSDSICFPFGEIMPDSLRWSTNILEV